MKLQSPTTLHVPTRLRVRVRGAVQGVGFRPRVYGLARTLGLSGFVLNDGEGVLIEVQGAAARCFVETLSREPPPLARINALEVADIEPLDDNGFAIRESREGRAATRIAPDAATCPECLSDLFDPASRFYRYPFVTCTHCGPRFTLTRRLPYDRAQTGMAGFRLCAACARDYANPASRRFHAETIACPTCGPRLSMEPEEIAEALRSGRIVALKGIGGFHLLCNARRPEAVARLRERKQRDGKPFAVMVANAASVACVARPSADEMRLVEDRAAPIVLMEAKPGLAAGVAPGLSHVGVFLAYAPPHHLVFAALSGGDYRPGRFVDAALVATSANPGGEPLITDDTEASRRLEGIADLIVTHDRPIVTRADDSLLTMIDGAPVFLRRARGYVPEPIDLGSEGPATLALGAHLKTTVTVTRGREAFVSQHVGDLDDVETLRFHRETTRHLLELLDVKPQIVACDLHPDFHSTRLAEEMDLPILRAQHHAAHIAAIAAEHGRDEPVLGVALDGYGRGDDGGAWGGELMLIEGCEWRRVGHLAPLPLPGGDRAAREPWRMALAAAAMVSQLDEETIRRLAGDRAAGPAVATLLCRPGLPTTTSLGRLFDAAAAILGVRAEQREEAQAAMELEALTRSPLALPGAFSLDGDLLDFSPLLARLLVGDLTPSEGADLFPGSVAAGLAAWIAQAAARLEMKQAALGGGCMMNRVLAESLCANLRRRGVTPLLARAVPANDGGLSLGQAALARRAASGAWWTAPYTVVS